MNLHLNFRDRKVLVILALVIGALILITWGISRTLILRYSYSLSQAGQSTLMQKTEANVPSESSAFDQKARAVEQTKPVTPPETNTPFVSLGTRPRLPAPSPDGSRDHLQVYITSLYTFMLEYRVHVVSTSKVYEPWVAIDTAFLRNLDRLLDEAQKLLTRGQLPQAKAKLDEWSREYVKSDAAFFRQVEAGDLEWLRRGAPSAIRDYDQWLQELQKTGYTISNDLLGEWKRIKTRLQEFNRRPPKGAGVLHDQLTTLWEQWGAWVTRLTVHLAAQDQKAHEAYKRALNDLIGYGEEYAQAERAQLTQALQQGLGAAQANLDELNRYSHDFVVRARQEFGAGRFAEAEILMNRWDEELVTPWREGSKAMKEHLVSLESIYLNELNQLNSRLDLLRKRGRQVQELDKLLQRSRTVMRQAANQAQAYCSPYDVCAPLNEIAGYRAEASYAEADKLATELSVAIETEENRPDPRPARTGFWVYSGGRGPSSDPETGYTGQSDYSELFNEARIGEWAGARAGILPGISAFVWRDMEIAHPEDVSKEIRGALYTDADIQRAVNVLNKLNIDLVIDANLYVQGGEWCPYPDYMWDNFTKPALEKLKRFAANVTHVAIDSPLLKGTDPTCRASAEEVARNIAVFQTRVHTIFPEAMIVDAEPFPGPYVGNPDIRSSLDEWKEWLGLLARHVDVNNYGIVLDINDGHSYFFDDQMASTFPWEELVAVEREARNMGMRVIFENIATRYPQGSPSWGRDTDPEEFYWATIRKEGDYLKAGGNPDYNLFVTWVSAPHRALPDSGGYTLMHLVKDLQILRQGRTFFRIEPTRATVTAGQPLQIRAFFKLDQNSPERDITRFVDEWRSSDPNSVSVNNQYGGNGNMTIFQASERPVTITARFAGLSAQATITVPE